MPDVMTADALLEVVASTSWAAPVEREIILVVGRFPDGVEASKRWLAKRLGRDPNTCNRRVARLVEQRVLLEVIDPAGQRGRVLRVNPDIGQWRDVDWRIDPELVAFRAFSDHKPRVVGGSTGHPQPGLVGGSTGHPQISLVGGSMGHPRKIVRGGFSGRKAPTNREPVTVEVPTAGRGGGGDRSSSSTEPAAEVIISATVERAIVNGRGWGVAGPLRQKLALVEEMVGAAAIVEAMKECPPEFKVPMAVDWLWREFGSGNRDAERPTIAHPQSLAGIDPLEEQPLADATSDVPTGVLKRIGQEAV